MRKGGLVSKRTRLWWVEVLVWDAQGGSSKQTYQIVVGRDPVNEAPTIKSQPRVTADVNAPYRYQVVAQDPENGVLTYGLKNAPSCQTTIKMACRVN
jgi:hypothetical protein